ncbi:MAG: hypothetical protein TEF_03950 [Rhizobiales bacterium NRL2]|nr:MAG: hypothetical protein TEF_03950 [Rhizobiales bacterium NRL2]
MDLLFRREQTEGKLAKVQFKLWAKVELEAGEQELVKRYRFDDAILIAAIQPKLLRNAGIIGLLVFFVVGSLLAVFIGTTIGVVLGLAGGIGAGYWYFHEKRETIFVKDLLHGRHFSCPSVIELARKEAWLETITGYLRQVMESAKHWDGTESHRIEPLPKDEARQVILRGL